MTSVRLAVILTLAAGCQPADAAPGALSQQAAGAPAVVVREVVAAVPEGGDGPDTVLLAAIDDEGARPLEGPAVGGVGFQGGALVLRPDGRLEMVREGATGSVIDRDVTFSPVVSSDGEHAAWAAQRGDEQVLVVIDRAGGRADAVVGLGSIGAVSFEEAAGPQRRLAFVGAMNGGVAGLWAGRVDGSATRCLTNCALRTGQPWGDDHVPLPEGLARFDGDAVVFEANGEARRLVLPDVLR